MLNSVQGIDMTETTKHTHPIPHAHPEFLRVLASMFGLAAAPAEKARILHLGCGSGSHLLALATYLPNAHLVGIDEDAAAIDRAQQTAKLAGFSNVRFVHGAIEALSPEAEAFDYVVCHDVISHVNDVSRDSILRQIADVLAKSGVAMISYDAYPGWRHYDWWRKSILAYLDGTESATTDDISGYIAMTLANLPKNTAWVEPIRKAGSEILNTSSSISIKQLLNTEHRAFTLSEFVQQANQHGLVYAGDTQHHNILRLPFRGEERTQILKHFEGDPVARQDYCNFFYDVARLHTLLVKQQKAALNDPGYGIALETLLNIHVQGHFLPPDSGSDKWQSQKNHGIEILDSSSVQTIFEALNQAGSSTISVSELLRLVSSEQHEHILHVIVDLISVGALNMMAAPISIDARYDKEPKLRPRLRKLIKATMQSTDINPLTDPWLKPLQLDDAMIWLATKMTGQCSDEVLAKSLAKACSIGKFSEMTLAAIAGEDTVSPDWQKIAQLKTKKLIEWLAFNGLLVAKDDTNSK